MTNCNSLSDIIDINDSFRTAVNLCLSINKAEKILNYIPTKSSAAFLDGYLNSIIDEKEHATLLVGPYGKGKSHLLLVFMAILSMQRNEENSLIINKIANKFAAVDSVGENVSEKILKIWNTKKPFLPVLISNSVSDLNQSFLLGINDALKREKINNLIPDTAYSVALKRINEWKSNYPETFTKLDEAVRNNGKTLSQMSSELKQYSIDALSLFEKIYPTITAGSKFNPLAMSDVLSLYKAISDKLVEDFNYSGIYIVFDEFSKFIESQDGKASGNNMKLLQDICELASESQDSQIYITMVAHKSIKEYGKYLSSEIINSFTGIEGRILEKLFITSTKNNYELIKSAIVKNNDELKYIPYYESLLGESAADKYYQLPAFRSNFKKDDFVRIILKGCYPLSPISAYLLLNVSEKVAQNERTLFTFISNDEPNSMARFVKEHNREQAWSVGADLIYDYFSPLFKKDVINEYIHNIWLSADYAIKKCSCDEEKKIIKALAIILIVNKNDELPAEERYIALAALVEDGNSLISNLINKDLIYKKGSTGAFVFKTRAGSELKSEIKRQQELKGDNVNYSKVLEEITGKYYVVPRKYNTDHMMTRFFEHEYMNSEDFLQIKDGNAIVNNKGDVDGKVITLYAFDDIDQEKIKRHVEVLNSRKLVVVCPEVPVKIAKLLRDYEILQELRANQTFTSNNEIITIEIPLLEEDIAQEIEQSIADVYVDSRNKKVLYFEGNQVVEEKTQSDEMAVNCLCSSLYFKSPEINNEIINRRELTTGQTRKARLNIIEAILTQKDTEEFYIGTNQEATIYRSLFVNTGILYGTESDNMKEILNFINEFVDSCCDKKVSLKAMMETLQAAPYGMRHSVIPIYLAKVLSQRNEDIVVYFNNLEVQLTADIVVNMCDHIEDYSIFVSKEDLQKEKYISSLNELFGVAESRNLTTNRIKNIVICMQRWFRALPQATRNATSFNEYKEGSAYADEMKELKKHLQKVEYNPFEILFVSLPKEFGTEQDFKATFDKLDCIKTAYDDYFDWLEQQVVKIIYDCFGGKKKLDLFHLLKEWFDKQSDFSKKGLHSGRITGFMSCIEKLNVYNDAEVGKKIAKAVTDVYLEDWMNGAQKEFTDSLKSVKNEIEALHDDLSEGTMKLAFTGSNGQLIERNYEKVDESTGSVLRNILEDTLDEYDDLSVNDRVGILLEMIEKILG